MKNIIIGVLGAVTLIALYATRKKWLPGAKKAAKEVKKDIEKTKGGGGGGAGAPPKPAVTPPPQKPTPTIQAVPPTTPLKPFGIKALAPAQIALAPTRTRISVQNAPAPAPPPAPAPAPAPAPTPTITPTLTQPIQLGGFARADGRSKDEWQS